MRCAGVYTSFLLGVVLTSSCVGSIEDPAFEDGVLEDGAVRDGGAQPRGPSDAGADARSTPAGATDARVPYAGRDAAGPPVSSGGSASSYRVVDGLLYDGCGEQVVLRGVNHPTIFVDRAGQAMPEIARTHANVVRLFWFANGGVAITEAEAAIEAAVANGMVPMLELHDSTCAWDLGPILDYWTSSDAIALIKRHEQHLLINIANEPKPPDAASFSHGYSDAVVRMRTAGIHVPLVIDGGNCGRDYQMLLDNGLDLLAQDPDHNLIFSAHLYDPLSASQIGKIFDQANNAQLPLIVGEFANHQPPGCGASIDYKSVISEAQRANIGWLAWSWGDNDPDTSWNTDCADFDMTSTFSFETLQGWGKEVAVSHADSIQNTAVRPYALTHGDMCK
ncbi:MAG: mannan endo,4-beta-mannosidase [Myxococcaceae bacterium]|nr:mannan endo,4-beta-mannosidase [Myxococcaceae bacterium]